MSQTGAWFWFRFTGLQKRHEVCKACVRYYYAYSFFHFPSNDFFKLSSIFSPPISNDKKDRSLRILSRYSGPMITGLVLITRVISSNHAG